MRCPLDKSTFTESWRHFSALSVKNAKVLTRRKAGAACYSLCTPVLVGLIFLVPLLINIASQQVLSEDYGLSLERIIHHVLLSQNQTVTQGGEVALNMLPDCSDYYITPKAGPGPCIRVAFAPKTPAVVSVMKHLAEANHFTYDTDIVGFENDAALFLRLSQYLFSRNKSGIAAAVIFRGNPENQLHPAVDYDVYTDKGMDSSYVINSQLHGFGVVQSTVQRAVDEAIMTIHARQKGVISSKGSVALNYNIRSFTDISGRAGDSGGSQWMNDLQQSIILLILLVTIVFGAMANFMVALVSLSGEKYERLLAAMRMIGVREGMYWLSWIASFFVLSVLCGLLTSIVAVISRFQMFINTDFVILWVLFSVFYMSTCVMAFPIVAVFNRSRTANIFAFLVFISAVVFVAVAPQPYYDLSGGNPMRTMYDPEGSFKGTLLDIMTLFPPLHFTKVFYDIALVTLNHTKYTYNGQYLDRYYWIGKYFGWDEYFQVLHAWGRTWDVRASEYRYYDYAVPSSAVNVGLMVLSWFVYWILSWYLALARTGDHGASLPFYFPLLPWYWGFPKYRTKTVLGDTVARERDLSRNEQSVRLLSLSKTFKTVQAVKELTLQFQKGKVFCLLGHNGAGKTTAINVLTGLHEPSHGEAFIFGHSLRDELPQIRQRLGICHQQNILWDQLTAEEHLYLYAALKHYPKSDQEAHVSQIFGEVSLDKSRQFRSSAFSGGMKRRLMVAISLIGDSPVLFLDEPSSGLDPLSRRRLWSVIEECKRDRVVVLTTHNLEEADALGDEIGILAGGRLRALGTSLFLKNKFGAGYQVNLLTAEENVAEVVQDIRRAHPDAEVLDSSVGSVTISVPRGSSKRISAFLRLMSNHEAVKEWGVSHTTLEEVFLRLAAQSKKVNESTATLNRLCNICNVREPTDVVLYTRSGRAVELSGVICAECADMRAPTEPQEDGEAVDGDICLEVEGEHEEADIGADDVSGAPKEEEERDGPLLARPGLAGGALAKWALQASQIEGLLRSKLQLKRRAKRTTTIEVVLITIAVFLPFSILLATPPSRFFVCPFYTSVCGSLDCTEEGYAAALRCMMSWKPYQVTHSGKPLPKWDEMNMGKHPARLMLVEPSSGEQFLGSDFENFVFGNESDVEYWNQNSFSAADQTLTNSQLQLMNNQTLRLRTADSQDDAENILYALAPSAGLVLSSIRTTPKEDKLELSYTLAGYDTWSYWKWLYVYYSNGSDWYSIHNFWSSFIPTIVDYGIRGAYLRTVMGDNRFDLRPRFKEWRVDFKPAMLTPAQIMELCLFSLAMMCLFPPLVSVLVLERRQGLVSLMRMIGLKVSSYWLSTWCFAMLLQVAYAGVLVILIVIVQLAPASRAWGSILGITILWGHSQVGVAAVLSALIPNGRAAAVISYVLMILCTVLVTIVSIIYPVPMPLYSLLPPLTYPRALVLALGAQTSDSNELAQLLGWGLIVSGSLYLIVGIYLHAVLRDRPGGVSRSFLLCLPKLWRQHQQRRRSVALNEATQPLQNAPDLETGEEMDETAVDIGEGGASIELAGITRSVNVEEREDVDEEDESTVDIDVREERHRVLSGNASQDPIQIYHLNKTYPKQGRTPAVVAVQDFCLGVKEGECFGLLGPNGAGKTTVVSMLSGILEQSSGSASVGAIEIGEDMSTARASICPQFDTHWDELTVRQHLLLYARLKGVRRPYVRAAAMQAAEMSELAGDDLDQMSSALSGGTRRRLSLAMALVGNPRIVFLDEPSTGIDAESRRLMWNLIMAAKRNRCMILTTHSMTEADALCTRIGIMSQGTLRCLGTQTHLKNKYGKGYTLTLTTVDDDAHHTRLTDFVSTTIPGSQVEKVFAGTHVYTIPRRQIDVAALFQHLEKHKTRLGVKDWALNQSSLEEVFMRICREAEEEEEGAETVLERHQFVDEEEACFPLSIVFAE